MYDGGNRISVKSGPYWSGHLSYTNACTGAASNLAGVGDVVFDTCKQVNGLSSTPLFLAIFSSATASITGVTITGNLGCDGAGAAAGNSDPLISANGHYVAGTSG